MKEVTTMYYCDRCGKKMLYPSFFLKRRTIKLIGYGQDYEVCKECLNSFRTWWSAGYGPRKEGV